MGPEEGNMENQELQHVWQNTVEDLCHKQSTSVGSHSNKINLLGMIPLKAFCDKQFMASGSDSITINSFASICISPYFYSLSRFSLHMSNSMNKLVRLQKKLMRLHTKSTNEHYFACLKCWSNPNKISPT